MMILLVGLRTSPLRRRIGQARSTPGCSRLRQRFESHLIPVRSPDPRAAVDPCDTPRVRQMSGARIYDIARMLR